MGIYFLNLEPSTGGIIGRTAELVYKRRGIEELHCDGSIVQLPTIVYIARNTSRYAQSANVCWIHEADMQA